MGLICIAGNPYGYNMGNLKTYFLTVMGLLDYNMKRQIIANYHLDINYIHIDSLNDAIHYLEHENNISMLLDELSSWIDCYDKPSDKNGGKDLKNLSKQTRKVKNKIYYSSQCYDDIPRAIRKLTSKVYITGKYHIANGRPVECIDDDCKTDNYLGVFECKISGTELIQMCPAKFYPVNVDIFNIYDTNEIIYTKKCELNVKTGKKLKDSTLNSDELLKKAWV